MNTELVAFVRARLDEEEQMALGAYGAKWEAGPTFGARDNMVYVREENDMIDSVGTCVIAGQVSNVPQFRANAAHIACWDPARVLTEIEAKRALIDAYVAATESHQWWKDSNDPARSIGLAVASASLSEWIVVLHTLAGLWSTHPDYPIENSQDNETADPPG